MRRTWRYQPALLRMAAAFVIFVMGGMSPMQALQAATINPSRYMGLDKDLGSIEAGKLADLVVMDANPLENIRNTTSIRYTMLDGTLYDSNLNAVAGGTHVTKPFWFQTTAGGSYTQGTTVGLPQGD